MTTKIDTGTEPESEVTAELEPEPTIVDEPKPELEIVANPESEQAIVDEPEPDPEIKELLVGTSADFPTKFAIELVSTSAARVPVFLGSPDAYDPLQILLEATGS